MFVRLLLLLAVPALFVSGPVFSQTAVITLDAGTIPPGVACTELWMEAGVPLSFVNTVSVQDCGGGSCFFGLNALGVSLFPSRLNMDVTTLAGMVTSVEADINDGCGVNCTRLLLFEGATIVASVGNSATGSATLIANAGAAMVDRVVVSSCEGGLNEVRINHSPPLPTEEETWGGIKALFED